MKYSLLKFALIGLAFASVCSGVSAENLIKNPDFAASQAGMPDEWKPYANKQKLTIDTQEVTGAGKQSLRVDIEAKGGKSLGQIVQKVSVKPNTNYLFKFDVKSSHPGVGIGQIKLYVGSSEIKRIATAKSSTSWKTVELPFQSGEANVAWIVLRYDQEERNIGQKVWFANIALEEGSPVEKGAEVPGGGVAAAPIVPVEPAAVPTFESVGLYWKPATGAIDNICHVEYRASGENDWHEAMPLWFDPTQHAGNPEHSSEYRGSLVHLKPGTTYEVKLRLAKDGTEKVLKTTTWNDKFPIAKTVTLSADTPQPIIISEGGSKEKGYVVYTAPPGTVLDGKGEADDNIVVNASYVILRGLTLKNAKVNGVRLGEVRDVVIENCDISGWGRIAKDGFGVNLDAAVFSRAKTLERIIIQNNQLHHPRSNANSWTEERQHGDRKTKHPMGPQGITIAVSRGNHVIRGNKIYSDAQHKFNDAMGETKNFSYGGFPNRDSDIYNNEISNAWDDGAEVEGADMNVRVWGNRFDDVYGAIGAATSSLGPLYVWRNVMLSARKGPNEDADSNKGAYFLKLGTEDKKWGKGKIYVFHNTMFQTPARFNFPETSGGNAGLAATGPRKYQINITSRNNILFVRSDSRSAIKDSSKDSTNDFDYDLYNGVVSAAAGQEKNGIRAVPLFDTSRTGVYPLAAGSPGLDAGVRLPNFNDGFAGKAPDVGAFESK